MASESIAHEAEAEGWMGYWLRDHEGEQNNNIVLVKSNLLVKNIETKQLKLAKRDSAAIVLIFKPGTFRYQWAITYSPVVAQPIRM